MNQPYPSWAFGDSPEMADRLLSYVLEGKKTGTCAALCDYEYHKEALPQKGAMQIILNGKGLPGCKIELTKVEITKFNEISATFAASEGEGDLSLAYWRKGHQDFFTRDMPNYDEEFSEDMPLVCVNFRVLEVY